MVVDLNPKNELGYDYKHLKKFNTWNFNRSFS